QAEDGIRVATGTGVQTCALPTCQPGRSAAAAPATEPGPATEPVPAGEPGRSAAAAPADEAPADPPAPAASEAPDADEADVTALQIGRASCRERVEMTEGGISCEE